jgi:hypothetical protein
MENFEKKGNTIKHILKRIKWRKKYITKKREKKTYSDEKYIYLKENEICFLSSNFIPTSKEKKIQK